MADYRDTVRTRIIGELKARLEAMSESNGDYLKWASVVTTSLESIGVEKSFGRLVGIFDRDEAYLYQAQHVECTLRVQVEYWYKVATGSDPSTEAERIRGNLVGVLTKQQALLEQGTGATLTIAIRLTNSDKDVDGPREDFIGGLIELSVIYRHKLHDPYKLQGQ